jgi:hypothetical protein
MNTVPKSSTITSNYNELIQYPISKFPILHNNYNMNRRTTIDDIIQYNINAIMPNVDIGFYQNTLTDNEIYQWIESSKIFINGIQKEYIQKCNHQDTKLQNIITQRKQCNLLNMNNISKLPDDIIYIIFSYLLPETKILFFLEKYSKKYENLKLLTVPSLKKYYKTVIYTKYFSYDSYKHKTIYYRKCLIPDFNHIRINPRNKTEYIEEIERLLQSFRNPRPYTNEIYHFFQLRALYLLKSIIYVGKRMGKVKKSSK